MADIVIIGGGAAGMMAAAAAAEAGGNVTLIEKNEKLGKKLFITGKGRCNVTNACEVRDLFNNILENPKFLYSAVYGFDNQSVMGFFEESGCKLKIERGQRVFPVSDHSSDIIKALEKRLLANGARVLLNNEAKKINVNINNRKLDDLKLEENGKKRRQLLKAHSVDVFDSQQKKARTINADSVIIATGGMSYALTGSTGDGYKFAEDLGHTVTPLSPALVPFSIKESFCRDLMGLSLKNVRASVVLAGKEIYSDFGEMLFTHYGVSGPLMLSAASVYAHKLKAGEYKEAKVYIDLKPALSFVQLDRRVLRDFDANKNKQFKNILGALLPAKLVPVMTQLSGIAADKKINEITKEERESFVSLIKHMELTITGLRGYDEAVITKGGVAVNEVNPQTMESKLVRGLYFAGEVLDVDALTGGFNLQIAWSTGHLAGESAVGGSVKNKFFQTNEVCFANIVPAAMRKGHA